MMMLCCMRLLRAWYGGWHDEDDFLRGGVIIDDFMVLIEFGTSRFGRGKFEIGARKDRLV